MNGIMAVRGITLTSMPIGEYDRRLSILTKEQGKITVFAKGARRPGSVLLAYTQPITYGRFLVYPGRNVYQLQGLEQVNYFTGIKENFDKICYATYFCELADYFSRENSDDFELLKLLYQSLLALGKESIGEKLARAVYELKSFYVNGEGAQVFQCVRCGAEENLEFFSASEGGCLCRLCGRAGRDRRIMPGTLNALQHIASARIEQLYDFRVSAEILMELEAVAALYIKERLDRRLKSLEMLELL